MSNFHISGRRYSDKFRSRLFKIILAQILIIATISCNPQTKSPLTGDLQIIKDRIVSDIMEQSHNDDFIAQIIDRMNEDGSFSGINYEDLSRTAGFPQRQHNTNLVNLARAYRDSNSSYYNDPKVMKLIIRGLEHWAKHDYFGDNWHNNQISTPASLVNVMLLVGDELSEELIDKLQPMIGRAHMNASGARPSGDRIYIAGILAKNLLFLGKTQEFDEIIRLIESEVKFSTGSRGMQHDYSFHHRSDRVNNTTSYGYGKYANSFGEWAAYVTGTRYAFAEEKINQLVDYYLDGICKQMVYGVYTDVSVKNRSITSRSSFAPNGLKEVERLLQSSDYRKDELEEIIKLRKGEISPTRSFCKFFWQTEHLVFQRPGFYTTVRMFSTRNRNMEEPYNGPGKPTHHRADGTNHLMLKGDEYLNIWPMFDWQKIPGTTVMQKPALPPPNEIQKAGLTDFVGGVTDDLYGAAVFDFISPHDQTKVKKSWFFFDDKYVCLGTAISGSKDLPVATTINQMLLLSEVDISAGGKEERLPQGDHQLKNTKWIYHNKTGYVFPRGSSVNLSNKSQSGRWSDITDQKNIPTRLVHEDIFLLWLDHGKNPDNGSYAYIVVPETTPELLAKESKDDCGVKILSNTSSIQGVINEKSGLCQLVFYEAGEQLIAPGVSVSLDSPGMIMLQLQNNKIEKITVSDPSRKLTKLKFSVSEKYSSNDKGCKSIIDKDQNLTNFTVDLPQDVYTGKSTTLLLQQL